MVRDELRGGSGVRLAVRTAGPLDAPPIVLVHGWAQSSTVFTAQLGSPLAERFRLIAVDLRGHGESEVPETGYDDPAQWARRHPRGARLRGAACRAAGVVLRRVGDHRLPARVRLGRGGRAGVRGRHHRAGARAARGPGRACDARRAAGRAVRGRRGRGEGDAWVRDRNVRVEAGQQAERAGHRVARGRAAGTHSGARRAVSQGREQRGRARGGDVPTLVVHGDADTVVDIDAGRFTAETVPGRGCGCSRASVTCRSWSGRPSSTRCSASSRTNVST